MTVARRLVARGRVQGVNFRAWVAERARSRGVAGYASNEADGSVEVWLEGDAEAVESVEEALRAGPAHARVESVEAADASPRGLSGFERR